MITPANLLTNNYLAALRRFLLERSRVDRLLVIDMSVFRKVSVDNAIFVAVAGERTGGSFPDFPCRARGAAHCVKVTDHRLHPSA